MEFVLFGLCAGLGFVAVGCLWSIVTTRRAGEGVVEAGARQEGQAVTDYLPVHGSGPPEWRKSVLVGWCKDCKHWDHENDAYVYDYGDSRSGYNESASQHRICRRVKLVTLTWNEALGRQAEPVELAFTQDGSGYKADLWTAPDFGCVQFEAREETP